MSVFGVIFVRIFPVFGLNTKRYFVRKKAPNTDNFYAV